MKYTKYFAVALGLLLVVAMVQPANAACAAARLMNSSYIFTPGAVYDYAVSGDSVTDQFAGTWWALGEGDPASPGGADSGTYPAQEWLYGFGDLGYATFIQADWASDARVDGCVDLTPATCVAIQLTDVNPDTMEPVFALLSAEQTALRNYEYALDGQIDLAPLPALVITNSTRVGETGVIVDVGALDSADFDGGLYLDPNCTGAVGGGVGIEMFIPGVAWVQQTLARGAAPPTDTNIATGGWMPVMDEGVPATSLFGAPATLDLPCAGDSDIYISYALLNESFMAVDHTTGVRFRVECGPNIADPAQRHRAVPSNRETTPRTRQR